MREGEDGPQARRGSLVEGSTVPRVRPPRAGVQHHGGIALGPPAALNYHRDMSICLRSRREATYPSFSSVTAVQGDGEASTVWNAN